ncbi:MAG: hypothetical protein JW750_12675 [Anaerolineaceae bacterium]|nr:hypothetical protein [Anaerolineaceae bacterium]
MPVLPERPNLSDYQQYVHELEVERGFIDQDVLTKCLLLGEEVGELFKSVRKLEGIKLDHASALVNGAEEELADVFIFLCSIANHLEIDLEQAFREKEEVNKQRTWR